MPETNHVIRALLVDPEAQTVSEVHFPQGDIHEMYRLMDCHCFDAVSLYLRGADRKEPSPVTVWCDDEGALKDPDDQRCVFIGERYGKAVHLAGKLLVTGLADDEGNTLTCPDELTPEAVRPQIMFGAPPVVPSISVRFISLE